jgi:hypothetical protein
MDAEALKIILELQEENTLLHRAIDDATVMLARGKKHTTLKYGIPCVANLFLEIYNILPKEKEQQPCAFD